MYNASELRNDFASSLRDMAAAYDDAANAAARLRQHVEFRDALPWRHTALDKAIRSWLSRKLEAVSLAHQGDSSAEIFIDDVPEYFTSIHKFANEVHQQLLNDKISMSEGVESALSAYDFANLANWIRTRAAALERTGLIAAADLIASTLGLNADYGNASMPSMRAGRYQFEVRLYASFSGYSYDNIKRLNSLAIALQSVERTMGIAGGFLALSSIVGELQYRHTALPSRTVLGKGQTITGTVFKEKIALALTPDFADTLFAFLALYASVPLVSAEEKRCA